MSFRYFYMMRILSILFVLILGISCTEKVEESKPLIEIYELNKWVESYETFEVDSTLLATLKENNEHQMGFKYSNELGLTANGGFNATTADLKDKPLITDNEIKGFDFTFNSIVTDSTVWRKLKGGNSLTRAKQLALTSNRKVIMTFRQHSIMSSFEIGTTPFFTVPSVLTTDETPPSYNDYIKLRHGPFRDNDWINNFPNLKKDTAFYNAFKRAGKIIAE